MALDIFLFLLWIISVWSILGVSCEYRNYKGGHRFVKAFRARGWFQRSLVILQRPVDIHPRDMGKLTYIGFTGAVVVAGLAFFAFPFTIYVYFFICRETAVFAFQCWLSIGVVWGIASTILQGLDSLLNRILP